MRDSLDKTLATIGEQYANQISTSSRHYLEVDIGRQAQHLGFADVGEKYRKVLAVVPLKKAQEGMKVRIDGRTFVNYGQLASGIAVPHYVVQKSKLSYRSYVPNDSMILNFT